MPDKIISIGSGSIQSGRRLIPRRLVNARKAVPLTQTELAEKIGLTRQAISAFEQGVKHPHGSTMFAIADVVKQPISYFFASMPEEAFGPFSARTFRAFGADTRRRNDQCEVLSEWLALIAAFYSGKINFPAPNVPHASPGSSSNTSYDEEEIEGAATMVRRTWGLGDGPIGNLVKLLESRGIFVGHLPLPNETINAFSFWSGAVPFILTGTDDTTAVRRRFDLAHELGHLVLHQGIGEEELEDKSVLDRVEAEANRFAGAFLLPAATFPNEIFTARLEAFVELKKRWKVAIAAQIYRCSDLGLFTDHQILNMRKQISARRWRKSEPLDNEIPIEQPSLIGKAVALLLEKKVLTPAELLSGINISPAIIENLSGLPSGYLGTAANDDSPVVQLK
jgi:Zn-dependent peptidase ImmA (M78 family)/transcriptional regulator with XRE-family HTH domain